MAVEEDLLRDLQVDAAAVSRLAGDEKRFTTLFEAFRAEDKKSFQRLLGEAELGDRCELVCEWLCSKECVLVCLELCGPPPQQAPGLREFAEAVVRIGSDERLVGRLADAVAHRNKEEFASLIAELGLGSVCHLLCHWVCAVRCRLVCEVVCGPVAQGQKSLAQELAPAAEPLRRLLADAGHIDAVAEAARAGSCDGVRGVIQEVGLVPFCELVCEWICTWRCFWLCLQLCGPFRAEKTDTSLTEAFEFAKVTARLAEDQKSLERLAQAVSAGSGEAYEAAVKELQLERFCIQLTCWICSRWCRLFCACICPPTSDAWFIRIGHYNYFTQVQSALGGSGRTIPDDRAFFETLRLNGSMSVLASSPQIEYRFETQPTDAAGNPTGPWSPVGPGDIGYTIIGWFFTGAPPPFTWINYAVNGTAGPFEVVAPISADGWIQVPPFLSGMGTFHPSSDLANLISPNLQPFPHHDETGVVAGGPAAHPLVQDVHYGIRMRVRDIGSSLDHDGGTCLHAAIDNTTYDNIDRHPDWGGGVLPPGQLAVVMVDIEELRTNGCADLDKSLTVLFTAAHPNLDPAGVSITLTGPGGPFAFALPPNPDPPGDWYGAAAPSGWTLSDLENCAYIVTLQVNVLLTDGDNVPNPIYDQMAFCKTS